MFEDPFSKGAQCIAMIMDELMLLMNFLQTKTHIKKLYKIFRLVLYYHFKFIRWWEK